MMNAEISYSLQRFYKLWVFTFWNLSEEPKCRVALTESFWNQISSHISQLQFHSRQICDKQLAN